MPRDLTSPVVYKHEERLRLPWLRMGLSSLPHVIQAVGSEASGVTSELNELKLKFSGIVPTPWTLFFGISFIV